MLPPETIQRLHGLEAEGVIDVFRVVVSYLRWRRSKYGTPADRPFTYDSVERHASINRLGINSRTLSRGLRRLAELGYLHREYRVDGSWVRVEGRVGRSAPSRRVRFVPTLKLLQLYSEVWPDG